jgi:hypothetical protein
MRVAAYDVRPEIHSIQAEWWSCTAISRSSARLPHPLGVGEAGCTLIGQDEVVAGSLG